MKRLGKTFIALGCVAALAVASSFAQAKKTIKIALIAKSSTNPVFLSARTGAEAAAKDLSAKYGINIVIDWRTPPTEDAQVQAERIADAVNEGDDAIVVSCSDAAKLNGAINDGAARGVPVMTFDSDAPQAMRFAFYGVDDVASGEQVMSELAKQLGGKGKIAILAGNQNAPNLRKRADGVKKEAEKYPGHPDRRHVLSYRDAPGRRGGSRARDERLSRHHGLGDDRRLAAVHEVAANGSRSRQSESGGRGLPARGIAVHRERHRAGPARAADVQVGLCVGGKSHRQDFPEEGRAYHHPHGTRPCLQGKSGHLGAPAQRLGLYRRAREYLKLP